MTSCLLMKSRFVLCFCCLLPLKPPFWVVKSHWITILSYVWLVNPIPWHHGSTQAGGSFRRRHAATWALAPGGSVSMGCFMGYEWLRGWAIDWFHGLTMLWRGWAISINSGVNYPKPFHGLNISGVELFHGLWMVMTHGWLNYPKVVIKRQGYTESER